MWVVVVVVVWCYSTYQATYKSRGVRYSQPNRQFGINAKYADCSSFVTSILTDIGMNCLFDAGRYVCCVVWDGFELKGVDVSPHFTLSDVM